MDKKAILARYFGYAEFRQGQENLIDGVLLGRDVFGIMPTGGGKSICYQVPALTLPGITLVVSPLISLMRDQVLALKAAGIPAAYINSSLSAPQLQAVYRNLLTEMELLLKKEIFDFLRPENNQSAVRIFLMNFYNASGISSLSSKLKDNMLPI